MSKRGEAAETAFWGDADDTEARERYQLLVNAIDDGLYQLDDEGRFVAINDVVVERTGYAREQLLGEPVDVLFDEDDTARIERETERLRRAPDDRGESLEVTVETASNERLRWELRISLIVEDGTVQGTIGIARDTAERRERELELERYERIVEAVNAGVYVVGADGRFTMVNEAYADMLGYDRENLLGEHVSLIVDEDVERRARQMEAAIHDGEVAEPVMEAELKTTDGDRITAEGTFAMLPGDDERWHRVGVVRDITERKRAQRRLEEERDMFAEGPAVVFRWKNEKGWPVEYVSDNAEDVLGYTPAELESGDVPYTDLLLDEELDRVAREVEKNSDGRTERFTHEPYRIETKDGDVRWVKDVTKIIRDETGEITHYLGYLVDLTERKERERELEASERRYRSLVENFPNGSVGLFDENLRYTAVGGQLFDQLDFDPENRVGESIHELHPPDLAEDIEPHFHAALAGETATFEVEYQGRHLDATTLPIENADGEVDAGMLVIQDVTEARDTERELRESETRFRMLAENLEEIVWMADEGAEEFIYVNPAFEDVWGMDRDVLYDDPLAFLELVHPDDRERVREAFTALPERELHEEYRVVRPDGEVRWVRSRGGRVHDEELSRVIGIGEDVTERKEREADIEESERLYRTLAENFPNGAVGVYDHDLRYDLVEGAMWDDIEPDAADLEGNTIHEALSEDIVDDIEPVFRGAIERGETDNVLTEFVGRTLRVWATPLRDSDGEIFAGLSFAQDITERIEREAELERALDLLDKTQRIADVGGWEIDIETEEVFWTDHIFELLEVEGDEEPPLDEALDMYHEEDKPLVVAAVERAMESGEAFDIEVRNRTGSGEIRWLRLQGVPETEDGEVVSFRGAAQDVTERKEREQELRQQRERLTALNNLNGIVRDINRVLVRQSTREEMERTVCEQLADSDSDSYEFAWFGTVDEETQEILPSTSANAQGYLDDVVVTAADSQNGQGPGGRAVRTRETQVVQEIRENPAFAPWHDQARRRGIEAVASIPVGYEDRFYGVLNVYTTRVDAFGEEEREVISQLGEILGLALTTIEHERQLKHEHERLAFINSLLRHNLLNDLNVVHARARILDPHVDSEGREHLEIVKTYTDEMAELIDTLRSLTEALIEDQHELNPVDLGAVLREEIDKTTSGFEDASIAATADLDSVPEVLADELLSEVFRNLLVNAVQHNDSDAPTVTVDVTVDDDTVTVEIADDGPGFSEKLKERLFEKGEKREHSKGTGYGLYLVHEILDLYDGEITAENTETGAVFAVTLPRA